MSKISRYNYKKEESIVYDENDEYQLTKDEYYKLYNFFVTHSMCSGQSHKKKNFIDYGWSSNNIQNSKNNNDKTLKSVLYNLLDIRNREKFICEKDIKTQKSFENLDLVGHLQNINDERFSMILKASNCNLFVNLFAHIRNCLAHGNFVLKYSSQNDKMIIMEDYEKDNINNKKYVTARIVLKLSTLLRFVDEITQ